MKHRDGFGVYFCSFCVFSAGDETLLELSNDLNDKLLPNKEVRSYIERAVAEVTGTTKVALKIVVCCCCCLFKNKRIKISTNKSS